MRFFFTIIFISTTCICQAQQSRQDLENARLDIIRNIEETQQKLATAEANKESTLSQLNALEKQIDARTALIANLQKDADLSQETIETKTVTQVATVSNTKDLTEDYYKLLRIRYRNKLLNKNFSALYSSERLNELITKWKYLKTYESMLIAKGSQINELDETIEEIAENIETETINHSSLIEQEIAARDSLKLLMQNLSSLAAQMTSEEKTIKQMLEEQTRSRERFNQAIEKSIYGSIGSVSLAPDSSVSATASTSAKTITDKKGFLPWPLQNAQLATRYGPQAHPTVTGIVVDNKGIDITSNDQAVTAIYQGEVISVAEVKGSGQTIIMKHQNEVYSVYANLESTYIQKGSQVMQGEQLGSAKRNKNGQAKVHFEIYQGKQNLNPNHWLKNN